MTISNELFMAILSMDTYNRGYNPGINGLSNSQGTKIGNATLEAVGVDPNGVAQANSFYAQSYTWNGQIVVAYRGTDDASRSSVRCGNGRARLAGFA